MHAPVRSPRPRPTFPILVILTASLLVASCEGSATQPSAARPTPVATTDATVPVATTIPSPDPTATPALVPDPQLGGITQGALAVTVSKRVRVRSEPGVGAASLKYTPVLPLGTQLVVTAGPVKASGYTWFRVAPVGVKLSGGADQGWVAVADHDGTPWVALADDPTPGFELAAASLERPKANPAAAKAGAKALNAFGVELYRQMLRDPEIAPPGKGVVFSPASIAMALAMARAGAKGETAAEMDRVLHVDGWKELGTGLNALDALLRSRDAAWKESYEEGDPHQLALRIANMAFGQDGFALEDEYLARIGRTFGSGLGLVDYINQTEAARKAINAWVSRQTMGRIPDLLSQKDVHPITRLILVNAIYLKAEWARPFMEGETTPRAFTTAVGDAISVPTMETYGGQDIVLASGAGWKATELRYAGPDGSRPLAMTLILPDRLASFEKTLSSKVLATIQSRIGAEQKKISKATDPNGPDDCGSYPYNVHLFMPRFGIDTRADLVPPLLASGMKLPLTPGADFSGMTAEDALYIGMVIHQANIDVDEKGTEAAAATAVGMDVGGCTGPLPAKTKTLRLDKPFLFVLRDVETGAILFMGRVTDPSAR